MQKNLDLNNTLIDFNQVSKEIADQCILHEISLSFKKGEFVCLLGESGSGKTTLLNIVNGLIKEDSGTVSVMGKIGMAFQNGALLPWLSVYENIELPLLSLGIEKEEQKKKVDEAISLVGLAEFKDTLPRFLSGGQRQRVGIARALAYGADILLLDEPFSALDIKTSSELENDLLSLWKETELTIIMVSHNINEAVSLASRVVIIENGIVKENREQKAPYPRDMSSSENVMLSKDIKDIFMKMKH